MTIKNEIKKAGSKVFRRCYVKRRDATTGKFESNWQEITKYVQKFGNVKYSVDEIRPSKFTFNNSRITVDNSEGLFSDNTRDASLWFGYAPRDRSLIKIEAGFYTETQGSDLIYSRTEYPTDTTMFIGVIKGDINVTSRQNAVIQINSLNQIFRDFPARNLRGFTVTGQTASKAIEAVRDMTDGSGEFIFKQYFNNDDNNFDISATTQVYDNLNTGAAEMIRDMTTWEMMEKLAEAESKGLSIDRTGLFRFGNKEVNTATTQFDFYGNVYNTEYGQTIKHISDFKEASDKFYSRVRVKFADENTITSYVDKETTMTVSGVNNSWIYGQKTHEVENFFIADTGAAEAVRDVVFNDVSSIQNEISFNTSYIPHLSLLDRVAVYYESSTYNPATLWDMNDWDTELIWDDEKTPFDISGEEFKIISIEINLDKFETKFRARGI